MVLKTLEFNSNKVFYNTAGEGPAVLLVHGFGEDGSIWGSIVEKLTENFLVLVPDLPGSGRSPLLGAGTNEDHISIEGFSEILNHLLIAENIESCIVIGHSMGGYITLAFAEKYPGKLEGIGMFHSSAFADNEEKKETRLKAIDFIRKNGSAAFMKTTIPNMFSKSTDEQIVTNTVDRFCEFPSEALTGYYYAMINRPDRIDVLKNFTKPVLFIVGKEDNAIPFEVSMKQCHIPLQSHVHILPRVGHMGMLEDEYGTAEIVNDFCLHCVAG